MHPTTARHAAPGMHACRNISAETFTARPEPAIGLKNAKNTTNTQLPESHRLATP
jgi:hypothetical protein